eukprot:6118255-Ditylum_brightwellii.AAC.1
MKTKCYCDNNRKFRKVKDLSKIHIVILDAHFMSDMHKKDAEGNTPHQQLLSCTAQEGCGVEAILMMIETARNEMYYPTGYNPQELDEPILLWKMGSHALVYAENHSYTKCGPSI